MQSLVIAAACLCALGQPEPEVISGLRPHAIVIADDDGTAKFAQELDGARLIGLGEATHGQHEVFEFKRRLTMALVKEHRVRLVMYEASGSSALATDGYVRGEHDDLTRAVRGLGMMIWRVEENAEFLRELREWNLAQPEAERVRFVGVDVQDGAAAAARLETLVGSSSPELIVRAKKVAADAGPAVNSLWSTGDPAEFNAVAADAKKIVEEVRSLAGAPAEAAMRAKELQWTIEMHRTPGGRDLAMAERTIEELELHAGSRAVLWAHNGHITRGPLDYLNSNEPAMGGHLARKLGTGYFALGVCFGSGEFQALHEPEPGRWAFKTYATPLPVKGTVEWVLQGVNEGSFAINLRSVNAEPASAWLERAWPYRWYGGYRVREESLQAKPVMTMTPRRDFDGLAFFRATTAAHAR